MCGRCRGRALGGWHRGRGSRRRHRLLRRGGIAGDALLYQRRGGEWETRRGRRGTHCRAVWNPRGGSGNGGEQKLSAQSIINGEEKAVEVRAVVAKGGTCSTSRLPSASDMGSPNQPRAATWGTARRAQKNSTRIVAAPEGAFKHTSTQVSHTVTAGTQEEGKTPKRRYVGAAGALLEEHRRCKCVG